MSEQATKTKPEPMTGSLPSIGRAPFYIGIRYLLKKRLSYLAIIGVAISVGTLLVVMSVMKGFENQFRAVVRGYLSDLSVQPVAGKLYSFTDWREVMAKVRESKHVVAAAPYIDGVGLLRVPGSGRVMHIAFRGIDPKLEKGVSGFGEGTPGKGFLLYGELQDLDRVYIGENREKIRSCLIGRIMAGVKSADSSGSFRAGVPVVLVTATGDLRRRIKKYAVVGVFETGKQDYDASLVVMSLETAMDFVDARGGISGLNVRLDDYANAPQVVAELHRSLGPQYEMKTWEQRAGNMLKAVVAERFLMALILCFIGLLAGFCIFAILTMTVYEKRRDIGILKAIGFTPARAAMIFVVDGVAIGAFGALLGVALGMAFICNINEIADFIERLTGWEPFPSDIYFFTEIPADKGLVVPIIVAGAAILSSLIFSALPALKAARLDPVQTLHYE